MNIIARVFLAILVGLAAALVTWLLLAVLPFVHPESTLNGQIPGFVGVLAALAFFLEPYFAKR